MKSDLPVLVLNQTYEPLNICRARRALVLIYQNKAELVENGSGTIQTFEREFDIPSVIRLSRLVKRPRMVQRKLTRHEIFRRDDYTCQYCGKQTHNLTLDHVIPRSRGGKHTWENVVSACPACNRKKAGWYLEEIGLKLRKKPAPPGPGTLFHLPSHLPDIRSEWEKYLPDTRLLHLTTN